MFDNFQTESEILNLQEPERKWQYDQKYNEIIAVVKRYVERQAETIIKYRLELNLIKTIYDMDEMIWRVCEKSWMTDELKASMLKIFHERGYTEAKIPTEKPIKKNIEEVHVALIDRRKPKSEQNHGSYILRKARQQRR